MDGRIKLSFHEPFYRKNAIDQPKPTEHYNLRRFANKVLHLSV